MRGASMKKADQPTFERATIRAANIDQDLLNRSDSSSGFKRFSKYISERASSPMQRLRNGRKGTPPDVKKERDAEFKQKRREEELERCAAIIRTYRDLAEAEYEPSGLWIDNVRFDFFMLFLILLNCFVIGLEIDSGQRSAGNRDAVYIIIEWLFVVVFWAEVYLQCKYKKWWWVTESISNFLALVVAVFCTLDAILWWADDAAGGWLRMFSILRVGVVLRFGQAARVHKWLMPLNLTFRICSEAFQIIFWWLVVSTVIIYACAILLTKDIGHDTGMAVYVTESGGWDSSEYFSTTLRSMNTLFQVMTLNHWSSAIVRNVMTRKGYMAFFFVGFALVSALGLLNIIVCAVVERTMNAFEQQRRRETVSDERNRRQDLEGLGELFELLDEDGNGELEPEEFYEAAELPEVRWKFRQLEVNIDDAAGLFQQLGAGGVRTLSIQEFLDGCMSLKGHASSKDMLKLQAKADTIAGAIDGLEDILRNSEQMMSDLDMISMRVGARAPRAIDSAQENLANAMIGRHPVKPIPRTRVGVQERVDLSVGNRPLFPQFPDFTMTLSMDRITR